MKIIRKRPGAIPEILKTEDSEVAIQALLGGDTKMDMIAADVAILSRSNPEQEERNATCVLGLHYKGTILVVGVDEDGFCNVPNMDFVLWNLFLTVHYERTDRRHHVWRCRHCGYIQQFEADGPFENGWNHCPSCGGAILRPVLRERYESPCSL